jgi:predicted GNAT family N-acyltransferase
MTEQTEPLQLPEDSSQAAAAPVEWQWCAFDELSLSALYTLLQVRQMVFIVERLAPTAPVRIGAQMYLERFYEKAGFRRVSAPYDEDGIVHIEMLREARGV